MKNFVTLLIIGGIVYFSYLTFSKTDTVNQPSTRDQLVEEGELDDILAETPRGAQGALVDINDQIQNTLENARETVDQASVKTNDFIEAGIVDLVENIAEKEDDATTSNTNAGVYVDYDDVDISTIDGKIVLDFYASWCPSCRKLEKDIKNSLTDIPEGVTIVKVNYDSETELKQKYGVTRQHTLVQVDQSGNMITKWSGGNTLESIISELQ